MKETTLYLVVVRYVLGSYEASQHGVPQFVFTTPRLAADFIASAATAQSIDRVELQVTKGWA